MYHVVIVQAVWKHEMYNAIVFLYSNYGSKSCSKKNL
jgi:hypothetical protein